MWTRAASVLLIFLGGNASAQSAEKGGPSAPDSLCFQAVLVDLACSKLPERLAQQPNCLDARSAQQKCLEQVLPDASAGPNSRSPSGPTLLAPPAAITSPEPSPERSGRANSVEGSGPEAAADQTESPPQIPPKANSANIDRAAVDDNPTAAIGAGSSAIVNEAQTPGDTSLIVIAVIHSTSNVKDSPNTFEVRCRPKRTELAILTDGAWVAESGNNIQVDYQINDSPIVRQSWILSTDGKSVIYNGDPVRFLRSMPNPGILRVTVADVADAHHEATFELAGLPTNKREIRAACARMRASASRGTSQKLRRHSSQPGGWQHENKLGTNPGR